MFSIYFPDFWDAIFEEYVKKQSKRLRNPLYSMFFKPETFLVPVPRSAHLGAHMVIRIRALQYFTDVVTRESPASYAPRRLYRDDIVSSKRFIYENAPTGFNSYTLEFPLQGTLYVRTCPDCNGTGVIREQCPVCHGMGELRCDNCGGWGYVRVERWDSYRNEYVTEERTCERCGGKGYVVCYYCNGRGYIERTCPRCNGEGNIAEWESFVIEYVVTHRPVRVLDATVPDEVEYMERGKACRILVDPMPCDIPLRGFSEDEAREIASRVVENFDRNDSIKLLRNGAPKNLIEVIEKSKFALGEAYFRALQIPNAIRVGLGSVELYPVVFADLDLLDYRVGLYIKSAKAVVRGYVRPYVELSNEFFEKVSRIRPGNIAMFISGLYLMFMSIMLQLWPEVTIRLMPLFMLLHEYNFTTLSALFGSLGVILGLLIPYVIGVIRGRFVVRRIIILPMDYSKVFEAFEGMIRSLIDARDIKVYVPKKWDNIVKMLEEGGHGLIVGFWTHPFFVFSRREGYLIKFVRPVDCERYLKNIEKLARRKDVRCVIVLGGNVAKVNDKVLVARNVSELIFWLSSVIGYIPKV